jgi:penicillin-binding protein 1C
VKEDPVPPPDLTLIEVCAYSGHLPTDACKERRQVHARRSAVPTRPCPYHQRVEVDAKTGLAVSPVCRAGRAVESRVYLAWPASIRRWLTEQHRSLPTPPAYAPGCEPGGAGHAPEILSPAEGQVALLIPGVSADQQEVPLEAEAAHDRELTWFVNGRFLGRAKADERLWWTPAVGTHEILVTDDRGLTSRRVLVVRARP